MLALPSDGRGNDQQALALKDIIHILYQLSAQVDKLEQAVANKEAMTPDDSTHSTLHVQSPNVSTAYSELIKRLGLSDIDQEHSKDPLDAAYMHWCTLMRCLPFMDTESQTYVRTVSTYAMRHLLRHKKKPLPAEPVHDNMITKEPVPSIHYSSQYLDEAARKRADGWVPTPQQCYEPMLSYPVPFSMMPSSTSSPSLRSARPKLRQWFKRHHRVAPENASVAPKDVTLSSEECDRKSSAWLGKDQKWRGRV
ncbi:uncharacterized protein BYT42DRAFT_541977 [Radiomyces spectabilis]|uniref:uncharacterized protein n=1 Tax=Radiomyces spectabilis TaxID=64574 RepID=UPI00221E47BE|nr:uncharacterized protein BYT42DRAFT_541977 [Radiomyces spectabilis]KAI8393767.1 hypothetical protein BYT42DRAFT_541977 [Radiomyces spectabilis]